MQWKFAVLSFVLLAISVLPTRWCTSHGPVARLEEA